MTENVITTTPDTTLEEVARLMKREDTGAIPVVEDDELLGIVTDRDIVVRGIANGNDSLDCTVREILSGDLETIEPDADADEAADLMGRRQVRRLPVVENGRLSGMFSLGYIAVKERDVHKADDMLAEVSKVLKKPEGLAIAPHGRKLRVRRRLCRFGRTVAPSEAGRRDHAVRRARIQLGSAPFCER